MYKHSIHAWCWVRGMHACNASIACKVFVTNQTIRFQVNDSTRPADTWVIDRK